MMVGKKKFKYGIGEIVVVIIYGIVGIIIDIKVMDGIFVYEINYSEGFFLEDIIEFLEEYEG